MNNSDMPASPVLHTIDGNWVKDPIDKYLGLTKREVFVMVAMQGLCANSSYITEDWVGIITRESVRVADALLKELEENKENEI